MSTKTSIKRIALVAVSALGFGLLSVVPAKAAVGNGVIAAPSSINVVVGQQAVVPVVVTSIQGDAAANDDFTVTPTADGAGLEFKDAFIDASFGGMNVTSANTTNGWAITRAGTGAIKVAEGGDASDSLKANIDTKQIGSIRFDVLAAGQYTVTLATTGDLTAADKTFKVYATSQTSSLQASTLLDGTNGSIIKVSVDTPTIMVTRPIGQPTGAGAINLEVVSAPDIAKFPVGVSIRSGDLIPGTGVTLTSIASGFGTSYTFPALSDEGLYEFKAYVDANNNNLRDSSESSADVSFRVVGIPTKAVVSLDSSSTVNGSVNKTFNATVTMTDANGYATYAASNGVPTFTISSTVTATAAAGAAAATDDTAAAGAVRIGTTNTYRAAITRTGTADSDNHTFKITPVCPTTACTTNTAASFTVSGTTLSATATKLELASATGIYSGTVGAASYTTAIPADSTAATDANVAAGTYGAVAVTADPAVTSFTFTLTGTAAKTYTVTTIPRQHSGVQNYCAENRYDFGRRNSYLPSNCNFASSRKCVERNQRYLYFDCWRINR